MFHRPSNVIPVQTGIHSEINYVFVSEDFMKHDVKLLAAFGGESAVPKDKIVAWPAPNASHLTALNTVISSGRYHRVNHPVIEQSATGLSNMLHNIDIKAVGSGTAALHVAFDYFKKPHANVMAAALNWPGAVAPILFAGMEPYFVDVELADACIGDDVCMQISSENSSIFGCLLTHLFGNVCAVPNLRNQISSGNDKRYFIVDDCAQAIGMAVTLAEFVGNDSKQVIILSGNGSKHLGAGEIGYLCSYDKELIAHVDRVSLSSYYHNGQRIYSSQTAGFNYRPNVFSAAIVNARIPTLLEQLDCRRKNANYFFSMVRDLPGLVALFSEHEPKNSFYLLPLRLDFSQLGLPSKPQVRDKIVSLLQAEGVPAGVWVDKPVWEFLPKITKRWQLDDFPNTKLLLNTMLHISELAPPNDFAVMDYYVQAFYKVWKALPALEEWLLRE